MRRQPRKVFQFHIGAINRLRDWQFCAANKQFQFHIGAINRGYFETLEKIYLEFQFHIGAINSLVCFLHLHPVVHFNSTLVRLTGVSNPERSF